MTTNAIVRASAQNRKPAARFVKGQSGNPAGRTRGVPNKATVQVKAAFEAAFQGIGGVDALISWAKTDPGEFFRLYAKLLPVQVNHGGLDDLWRRLGALPDDHE